MAGFINLTSADGFVFPAWVAQTTHVAQAADDFLSAVTYLDTPIAPRATPTAGIGPHDV